MDIRFYVIDGNYPANSCERDEIVPKVTEMRTSPVTKEKPPLTTVSKYRFRGQNDNQETSATLRDSWIIDNDLRGRERKGTIEGIVPFLTRCHTRKDNISIATNQFAEKVK